MNASITNELLSQKLNEIDEAIAFFEHQSNSNLEYWTRRYDSDDDADKLKTKQSWHKTEMRKIETLRFAQRLLCAALGIEQ
jgi:hypothetical protein